MEDGGGKAEGRREEVATTPEREGDREEEDPSPKESCRLTSTSRKLVAGGSSKAKWIPPFGGGGLELTGSRSSPTVHLKKLSMTSCPPSTFNPFARNARSRSPSPYSSSSSTTASSGELVNVCFPRFRFNALTYSFASLLNRSSPPGARTFEKSDDMER